MLIYFQVAVYTSFCMIKLKSLQRKTGLYNERGKHMNKLISLLTALGLIFGSVPGISLILGMSAYADNINLTDAQKLNAYNSIVKIKPEKNDDDIITRAEAVEIIYNTVSDMMSGWDSGILFSDYKDITNGFLNYKICFVNRHSNYLPSKKYENDEKKFYPNRYCTMKDFLAMAFSLTNWSTYVVLRQSELNLAEYSDCVMETAIENKVVDRNAVADGYLSVLDAKKIMSKILFSNIFTEVSYSCFGGPVYDWGEYAIQFYRGLQLSYGKIEKNTDGTLNVGDVKMTGDCADSLNGESRFVLYEEKDGVNILHTIIEPDNTKITMPDGKRTAPDDEKPLREDKIVTREYLAEKTVELYESVSGNKYSLQNAGEIKFDDEALFGSDSVKKACALGFMNGVDSKTFAPDKPASGAQIAAAVYRVMNRLNQTHEISNPYIVPDTGFVDKNYFPSWCTDAVRYTASMDVTPADFNFYASGYVYESDVDYVFDTAAKLYLSK